MSNFGLAASRARRGNAGDRLAELMAAGLQSDDLIPDEADDVEFEEAAGTLLFLHIILLLLHPSIYLLSDF